MLQRTGVDVFVDDNILVKVVYVSKIFVTGIGSFLDSSGISETGQTLKIVLRGLSLEFSRILVECC